MSSSFVDPDQPSLNADIAHAECINAQGLRCPLPLLKAKQALNRIQPGECVQIFATDVGAVRDFPAFAELSGHTLLKNSEEAGVYEFVLQKRSEVPL